MSSSFEYIDKHLISRGLRVFIINIIILFIPLSYVSDANLFHSYNLLRIKLLNQ